MDWTYNTPKKADVTERLTMMQYKQTQIDTLKYEKDLIEQDIINTIKNSYTYEEDYNIIWGGNYEQFFSEVKEHLKDKRKHKDTFNFIDNIIKTKLLDNHTEFELCEVIDFHGQGWVPDVTSYRVYYKYKDIKLEVAIPNFKVATVKDYEYLLAGTGILYQVSENVWNTIGYDINYKNVAEKFKEWIKDKINL